jgi:hypothetical protein
MMQEEEIPNNVEVEVEGIQDFQDLDHHRTLVPHHLEKKYHLKIYSICSLVVKV